MPTMPDPTSTCPIFDRLKQVSQDPQRVKSALNLLENSSQDFVALGRALGVIDPSHYYCCRDFDDPGDALEVSEAEWLERCITNLQAAFTSHPICTPLFSYFSSISNPAKCANKIR